MKQVWGKLGKMRKAQDFVVFADENGDLNIQSDKSIGIIRKDSNKGILNTKGCYFMHLNKFMGAVDYEFPAEFVEQCKEACVHKGDSMGGSVIFGGTV